MGTTMNREHGMPYDAQAVPGMEQSYSFFVSSQ